MAWSTRTVPKLLNHDTLTLAFHWYNRMYDLQKHNSYLIQTGVTFKMFRHSKEKLEMKPKFSVGIQSNRRLHFIFTETFISKFPTRFRQPDATQVCLGLMITMHSEVPPFLSCPAAPSSVWIRPPQAGLVAHGHLCVHVILGRTMMGTQRSPISSICSQIQKVWIVLASNNEIRNSKEKVNCTHPN